MPYQNIDATLSATDLQTIKTAFATILEKLTFLVNLTVDERRGTFKAGPNSLSFIQNALTAALNNPTVLPASFNTDGFKRDADLFVALTEICTLASSLASQLDDTRLAVGGETMQEASQVYTYFKAAARTTPGLKPIADQLAERFQKAGKPKPDGTPKA